MTSALLDQLNPAQREAVSHIDGPLMIVAGAGTGKTKVITSRILHLLLDKKVPSSSILALTFTEKAAEEMIGRVDEGMPLSYEEVAIKTFHGFCETVLRERGHEIGIDPGYTLLSQTKQWLFLKNNLYEFELHYYRPLGNPSKFFFTLLNHFSRLKDEDINPGAYTAFADSLAQKVTNDVEREHAAKMKEVANAYFTYQRLMAEQSFLDFGDLIYYTLRLFEMRPTVLQEYQEQYQNIMVDEFQDTNLAQNKLVMMLASKHRNLTVVGDDDQSIYKWRGASLSNIRQFEKHFPDAQKVVLTQNYRSTQNILDASYSVIQNNNPDRLEAQTGINKKLQSERGAGEPVEISHFQSSLDEVASIVTTIQKLREKTGCRYKDFAILLRTNQLATPFLDALKDAEIPFAVRDSQSLLRFEEIKDLLALLRFLARPHDDIAFFRLLTLPIFGIPMRLILSAVEKAKAANYEPLFFYVRAQLGKDAAQATLPVIGETDQPFIVAHDLFDHLLEFSRTHSVNRILGEFLEKSGYFKSLTETETLENAEKIEHIAKFMEMTREFENESDTTSLRAFIEYIELLEDAQGFVAPTSTNQEDAVPVLTVHSSKGLEFDYVFLPSVVHQRFPSTNRRDPLEIPPELIAEELPSADHHLQEERRLFYVACTRARTKLFISHSDTYEGRKKWKPSTFIAEIKASGCSVEHDNVTAPSPSGTDERLHVGIQEQAPPHSEIEEKMLYLPEIDIKQLSYSKVDTFQTCPLKYKFRYLFELPSPSAHAANFGSSVHETVNNFYVQIKNGVAPSLELLKELYEKSWIAAGYESRAHEQARKKKGWEIMEKFYAAEEVRKFVPPAFLERPFRLKIGDLSFSGRIDRVDKMADGSYEVIDYKTGSSKKGKNLSKDLQLSLYALACRDVFRIPVGKLSLYFLEDGSRESTTRTKEDLEKLQVELLEMCEEMKRSKYEPTPGFHCSFCEYRLLCHAAE